MAALGEKIAASFVSDVLKKLSSYPEKKIIAIWNVEKEFQKLGETFGMLLAVLRDAEKRQDHGELIGRWFERLKDVAFDADDLLGEFSFEAARMGFDMRIDHSKMEKVRAFFSNIHAVKFRSNMADKMKKIYKKLSDIGEDMKSFNYILGGVNIDHSDQNDRAVPIITSPVIEDLQFLGRENEKTKLIDMLIGCSSSDEETLSVVSIVGIGGLGKTTLARIVYKDDSVVKHFDERMWVWVSRDFEIRKLRERMVQSLEGVKPKSSGTTDEAIQKRLDEKIGGKKFLLVLDDVWNVDIGGWEKLRASLKIGAQGSKIIVTTRHTSVASIIRTLPDPLHLEGLSEKESWSLFRKRAFAIGGARENPNTERIGWELVKNCKGVPLAIQSLGALMHSKTTDLQWASMQFSEIWKLEGQDNISSVLKLSYHDMPPPLKRCFTYCSIFPKGHEIMKTTLIQMWMAEGLLQSSIDDKLMEDIGLEYFKSLVWVSFLQDVERDKFGEEVTCKMHDLVHDLAQSIIGNECRIVEDFDKEDKPKVEETRYLSVVGHYKKPTPEEFNTEKVRAYLYLGGSFEHADPIPTSAKMFSNFKSLRVLALCYAGIESLSSSIGELKQLRYLDLSGNNFETFPKPITKLYNLQTLKMLNKRSFASTLLLPQGITKMINLRHLEVDYEIRFPKGIGQLTNLQALNRFPFDICNHEDTAGIGELGDLRQLGGTLILNIHNWQMFKNDTAANLEELRLRELELRFNYIWRYTDDDSVSELLESLKPHKNLIKLWLVSFTGTKAPTWLDGSGTFHLSFLQDLQLYNCVEMKSLSLAGLCSLRWLRICDCPNLSLGLGKGLTALEDITCENLMSIGVTDEEDGILDLISLKTLKIHECKNLATLPAGLFSLTSLETLEVPECSFVGRLPESIGNLSLLRALKIERCPGLEALPEGLGNLSSLRRLILEVTPSLTELPKSFGNLSSLQMLHIDRCERLAALPESFGNLLKLQVLFINECGSLAALPERFGNLSKLKDLIIQNCGHLAALPESLGNLLKLQELTIRECGSLAALPESFGNLLKLQRLTIRECGSLAKLPESFGNLLELQDLTIRGCGSLAALPESFGNLLELQDLTIWNCGSFVALPRSLGSSLNSLTISHCPNVASLAERICGLTSLIYLSISYCESMKSFPDGIRDLRSLQKLHICGLENLEALPDGLRNLTSLRRLSIIFCPRLMYLPDCIEGLTSIKRLDLDLENLRALPEGLGKLSSLESLDLGGCKNLKYLPKGIQNLTSLRYLNMRDCTQLKQRYRHRKLWGWPRIISHIAVIEVE